MLITTLADAVTTDSFAMIPFIVELPDGSRRMFDGHTAGGRPIGLEEETRAWAIKGALDVRGSSAWHPPPHDGFVAGWIGDAFLRDVAKYDAPRPDLPPTRFEAAGGGSFWIETPQVLYPRLKRFVEETAPIALERGEEGLVHLMRMTLFDHPASEALTWFFAKDEEARKSQIAWCMSIRMSGRVRPDTPAGFEVFFKDILAKLRR